MPPVSRSEILLDTLEKSSLIVSHQEWTVLKLNKSRNRKLSVESLLPICNHVFNESSLSSLSPVIYLKLRDIFRNYRGQDLSFGTKVYGIIEF